MRRRIILIPATVLCLSALPSALPAEQPPQCATATACLDSLIASGRDRQRSDAIEERLVGFGAEAVDLLVGRLAGGGDEGRVAGMALGRFENIDPRHLAALAAAYRAGNGWMPRPIAATGTDEAFDLLTAAFQIDPSFSSNAQVHFALARFGEARLRPFVTAQFGACRTGTASPELCRGLAELLGELPAFPSWGLDALAGIARSQSAEEEVQQSAEYELIRQRHPQGLAALIRELENARALLSPDGPTGATVSDSHLSTRIRDVGEYGAAGQEAVPLLLWALGRDSHRDARAAAALALGLIEAQSAAPAIVALEQGFADDWLLAYNSVESLGRLRRAEAQPMLERVAREHWYAPVRNNARRALNVLAGGAFERPGVPRDGAPYAEGDVPGEMDITGSILRYKGDSDLPRWCMAERGATIRLEQNPPGAIPWPRRGSRFVSTRSMPDDQARALRARVAGLDPLGRISVHVPTDSGVLIGISRGHSGGRLLHVDADGRAQELFNESPNFAYRLGGRLYVVSGVSHAMMSDGDIWEIDPAAARVVRRIRLPARAYRIAATAGQALVFETAYGAVAMRGDGSLADPATLGPCTP